MLYAQSAVRVCVHVSDDAHTHKHTDDVVHVHLQQPPNTRDTLKARMILLSGQQQQQIQVKYGLAWSSDRLISVENALQNVGKIDNKLLIQAILILRCTDSHLRILITEK